VLVVDSTGQLAPKLLLRCTPSEIAFVSVDDKDMCYTSIPLNDLVKWEVQAETELKLQTRTRAKLTARPDHTGFQSQRPTRAMQHFVFKSTAAKTISQCIDNFVAAAASEVGGQPVGGEDDEYSATRADADEPEEAHSKATMGKLKSAPPPPAAKRPVSKADEDEDDEAEAEAARPKAKGAPAKPSPASKPAAPAPASRGKAKAADDSEDDDDPSPP
jgi:hypothetical protein